MTFDEFIDRVNNGELEQIRAEQAEKEAEKALTNENNGAIMKDIANESESYNDISITEEVIANVPFVEIDGFTYDNNIAFQNAQKEILRVAKDLPLGTEVGAIYRADNMERIGDIIIGEYGKHQVNLPDADVPFISIHNHPDGKTFSTKDADRLIKQPNMVVIAAIGNNADSYVLQPLDNVDMVGFVNYASSEIDKLENQKDSLTFDMFAKGFENIWRGSEVYGVKYTQIQNNN